MFLKYYRLVGVTKVLDIHYMLVSLFKHFLRQSDLRD